MRCDKLSTSRKKLREKQRQSRQIKSYRPITDDVAPLSRKIEYVALLHLSYSSSPGAALTRHSTNELTRTGHRLVPEPPCAGLMAVGVHVVTCIVRGAARGVSLRKVRFEG